MPSPEGSAGSTPSPAAAVQPAAVPPPPAALPSADAPPPPRRIVAALLVAMFADGIGFFLGMPDWDLPVDIATAIILWRLMGGSTALLGVLLVEAMPVAGAFPTWTAWVILSGALGASRSRATQAKP